MLIRLYLILLVSASDPQATRETAMAEIPTPLRYRKKKTPQFLKSISYSIESLFEKCFFPHKVPPTPKLTIGVFSRGLGSDGGRGLDIWWRYVGELVLRVIIIAIVNHNHNTSLYLARCATSVTFSRHGMMQSIWVVTDSGCPHCHNGDPAIVYFCSSSHTFPPP